MGSYKLTADLDFSNINTSQNVYITETFLGLLDGNGFEITGLSKPLFNKIIYANIKNIEVKNSSYSQNETASLIKTAKNSMLENVTVYNSNPLPSNNPRNVSVIYTFCDVFILEKSKSAVNL